MKKILFFIALMLVAIRSEAGLSVSPSVIEKVVVPGHIYHGTYVVTNNGSQAISIQVEPEDWFKRLNGEKDNLSVKDWFTVNHDQITLQPKQRKAVRFIIHTPKQFSYEKSAQVFFSFQEQEGIRSRLGVVLYIIAKTKWKLNADVSALKVMNQKASHQESVVVASIKVKNKSNVHIRPQGTLEVYQKQNEPLAVFNFNKSPAIYPDKEFELVTLQKDFELPQGAYQGRLVLDIGHTYGVNQKIEKQFPFVVEAVKP